MNSQPVSSLSWTSFAWDTTLCERTEALGDFVLCLSAPGRVDIISPPSPANFNIFAKQFTFLGCQLAISAPSAVELQKRHLGPQDPGNRPIGPLGPCAAAPVWRAVLEPRLPTLPRLPAPGRALPPPRVLDRDLCSVEPHNVSALLFLLNCWNNVQSKATYYFLCGWS